MEDHKSNFLVNIPGWRPARVLRGALLDWTEQALQGFGKVKWRAANKGFLGRHQTAMFGEYRGRNYGRLPQGLREVGLELVRLTRPYTSQRWTTSFTGRHLPGDFVKPHRDPKNNTGYTAIAVFGNFQGAVTALHHREGQAQVALRGGDVLLLPCTMEGLQGPLHAVSPVTHGERFTLILNTVE